MAKKKKDTEKKPHFIGRFILRIAMVMFVVFCAYNFISVQNSIIEKKRELADLEEHIEALKVQNEELEDLIKTDDLGRYMEKLAVEDNDYAYPDERRYYDTSRD